VKETLAMASPLENWMSLGNGQQHTMLFDGDCGICTYFADLVKRIDRQSLFQVFPYQSFSEETLRPWGISHADCRQRLQVISRRGKVYRGAFAVNYFYYHYFPWSLLVILTYAFPVLLLLELVGYGLVASNRTLLSRWFGMKACGVQPSSAVRREDGPRNR
jgi:predicted DCC family thiol-disulfide oxidoreductase YuxK